MQLAKVIGRITATVRHASLAGKRMLVAQPLGANGEPDSDPVIVIDRLGAGVGQVVVIDSDGRCARDYVGDPKSPVRWVVMGIRDA